MAQMGDAALLAPRSCSTAARGLWPVLQAPTTPGAFLHPSSSSGRRGWEALVLELSTEFVPFKL